MVTTTVDVQPGEVAAALRKAGLTEIDTAARRRAEYSSDASNYRVVPQVVAFPRSADEIVAALAVCRRARRARHRARRGHLDRRQRAVGTGVVLDTSRHLNRVLSRRPGGADRGRRAGRRARRDHQGRRAARAAVRPRPVHPHRAARSAAMIGNNACGSRALALRAHRRQRGRARRADRHGLRFTAPARLRRARPPARRRTGGRRDARCRRRSRRSRQPGRDPHRVRPVHPAGVRLLARAPAAGERLRRRASSWSAPRAPWR